MIANIDSALVLDRAADWLDEHDWTQGLCAGMVGRDDVEAPAGEQALDDEDDLLEALKRGYAITCACLVGSVVIALYDLYPELAADRAWKPVYTDLLDHVSSTIGEETCVEFNDHNDRAKDEVTGALRDAAAAIRA